MLQFKQIIYVKIEKNIFSLLHAQSNKSARSQGGFSNARLAIAHFTIAQKSLNTGILEIYPPSIFKPAPIIVMHQIYNSEGGLCEIEERILKELALGVGARQVFVWQGKILSSTELINGEYQ